MTWLWNVGKRKAQRWDQGFWLKGWCVKSPPKQGTESWGGSNEMMSSMWSCWIEDGWDLQMETLSEHLYKETYWHPWVGEWTPTVPLSLTSYILCFQYFVFTGVLAMVTCAVFLRLNSVLKLAVLLIMIAIYALLTETIYSGLFLRYDNLNHSGE